MIARRFQPQFKNLVQLITGLLLAVIMPAVASAAVSASLTQCGNLASGAPTDCSWQNGNLNSNQAHWLEGDSVPYQLALTGLAPNTSYTVAIGYDTTKGGKHAIDYLTSYDRTMAGGAPNLTPTNGTANPCSGVTGCATPPNTFAIPQDPNVTSAGVTPISGSFAMFNGTITAASAYALSGSYSSDSQSNITLTFTSGPANASGKTNVVLAWGGHIATRANWGQNSGAVNITGSPFHTLLVSFSGGGGGAQDRALTANAVIFPATITITKVAIPTGSTSFPFTISPVLPVGTSLVSSFSLVNNGSSSNSVTYTLDTSSAFNVAYGFTESAVSGWSLIGLSCTADSVSGSTATTSGSTATITPHEAGIISCTYTNSEPIVAPPSFNPGGGTYTTVQAVTISTVTQGASIRYTTDGSTPSETAGILYTGPVTVNTSETLKALAFGAGMIDSAVSSATYTVNLPVVATPTFNPGAGTYSTTQSVTIGTTTQGASIRYTTDGSTPSETAGTLYTSPVILSSTSTVKAIAYETGMSDSAVASATYTLPISVTVSPSTATLYANQTQQFTATVGNTGNTSINWAITPSVGSISSSGLYTAPSNITTQQTVTVTATSQADNTKSATATITLSPPVAVSVTPLTATLYGGQTQQLSATVTNTGNTAVTWTILPAGVGTISASGLYTAPATIASEQTVTATATSQADTTQSSSATITLSPPVAISAVTPGTASLYDGQTQQFSATVTNAGNTAVTWTISPAGVGTVSSSGLYTAPATIASQQTVTVTATSQADTTQSSSATITLSPPVAISAVTPGTATLYGGQTQQFSATVTNAANTAVTWTISPAGAGTISSTGLYTAPAMIASSQTVTVTATSQADSNQSSSATVTLSPPVAISAVTPTTATLYGNQTQQFSATVTNSTNTAVTWTIAPAGVGTVNSSGLYTAPATIASSQTVTVTATSQADTTQSSAAVITLSPPQCTWSSPYAYGRILSIDHSKVVNTDQTDFPVLISGTYSFLATVANGGKVQNSSGYDIIFTSDAAGQNLLDFEIDSYNSVTGAAAFWVRIPTLSHTADTPIYMWYGNPNVTSSQQNKTGVWRNGYLSVFHFGSGATVGLSDSGQANYSLSGSATVTAGVAGSAASFNGSSALTHSAVAAYPAGTNPVTIEAWVNMTPNTSGEILGYGANSYTGSRIGLQTTTTNLLMEFQNIAVSVTRPSSGAWHHLVGVYAGGPLDTSRDLVYVDSIPLASTLIAGTPSISTSELRVGGIPTVGYCCFYNGAADEVRISSGTRSAGWIATEYANESSPSTFYQVFPEQTVVLTPQITALYASQSLQLAAIPFGGCGANVNWSLSPDGSGTITSSGLYAAPAAIATQQTVTITATSPGAGISPGTASIVLLPDNAQSSLSLSASVSSPYSTGSSQAFVAKLTDPAGTPEPGVAVSFTVAGVNPGISQFITDGNGLATYTYIGVNSGTDSIKATATINGQQAQSNAVSATWIPPAQTGSITLRLSPASTTPTLGLTGLCGAFTDSSGAVIEPVSIGASKQLLTVPSGATRLQLGINDDRYGDNSGSGFVVAVNGVPFTIPPPAMPWIWASGGLNSGYPYGLRDGTPPVITATNLFPGQTVLVAYQSGTVCAGGFPCVDANGYGTTGANLGSTGTHFSTVYMVDQTHLVGQPLQFSAALADASGNPIANTPIVFTVAGANAQQLSATSDASGTASVSYIGQAAGVDTVQAQASPGGSGVSSSTTTVIWTPAASQGPTATLDLSPASVQDGTKGGQVVFTVFARDASGNPLGSVGVGLSISGADNIQQQGVTDVTGHVTFIYQNVNVGTATAQSTALIGSDVIYSNAVTTTWNSTSGGTGGSSNISISIQANTTVTLPNSLQLSATVTDFSLPAGSSPTLAWSQVAGPGSTTFTNGTQANTTASFSVPGNYVLQLAASDGTNSSWAQIQVAVNSTAGTQGWIESPSYGSAVSGIVPITVAAGVTLTSGRLIYYAANDPYATNPIVLNTNTTGSGQIGTFDTTRLPNGSYYIQLQATDSTGHSSYSIALITVTGQSKPGRVTSTITDLVVPATGLAISIQRQYDSLNAGTSRDFGYGWSLGTNVDLSVDPANNVTFTIGGQRKTFYFTPKFFLFFLGYIADYTPEPGLAGSLTPNLDISTCPFGYLVRDGSLWECGGGGMYIPVGYTYTDASGTQYTISASGALQSIRDIGGNTLTVSPSGISSSTGLSVPFVRDSAGRITKITYPQGNDYVYSYDSAGNLASVTYPGITQPSTYSYDSNHLYLSGTDFRNNPLPTTTYYGPGDVDANGLPLNGRMHAIADALGATTTYAYNLITNTTTITYPQDANSQTGTATMVYDSYGMLLSSTDPLGHTTTNTYDPGHHLISATDPLGHTTSYTYDSQGNKTSTSYPKTATSTNTTSQVTYNQFSEPTSSTDELGNVRTYAYDANNWPTSVTDTINGATAALMSSHFNTNGTMQAGAIGYDITGQPSKASQFTYDPYGNVASRTDALGRVTSYTYDTLGRKISMTEPFGSGGNAAAATTTYQYDSLGHLTETDAPLGRTTKSSYDANGNKISDTDPNGNVTTYSYDSLNRLLTTTYPTSPATSITNTYDFRGNIITQTDQAGNVTKNVYDLAGRLTSVTKAYGTSNATTTTYTYYDDGRKHTETDAANHTTTYTYDAAGHLTAVAGPKGNFQCAYDNAGNKVSMTDANGHTTQYQYDARKRLTVTTYPTQPVTTTTNTYDGPGNLASVTDQAGNTINYTYDAANQLQTVIQTNSPNSQQNTTTYGYDLLGDLSSSSDANTHITINGFDLLSELKTKTLPDATLQESRIYDFAGNLHTLTHFNEAVTTYTYDSLTRRGAAE